MDTLVMRGHAGTGKSTLIICVSRRKIDTLVMRGHAGTGMSTLPICVTRRKVDTNLYESIKSGYARNERSRWYRKVNITYLCESMKGEYALLVMRGHADIKSTLLICVSR